jgi:hypothetical protein
MTLIKFTHGNRRQLWNLEVGDYEEITSPSELELCDWFIRSRQETLFSYMPKMGAYIYHMEYFGEAACGRCVGYKFFESDDKCLAMACEKCAKPHRLKKDIHYPPERSRYATWTNL